MLFIFLGSVYFVIVIFICPISSKLLSLFYDLGCDRGPGAGGGGGRGGGGGGWRLLGLGLLLRF